MRSQDQPEKADNPNAWKPKGSSAKSEDGVSFEIITSYFLAICLLCFYSCWLKQKRGASHNNAGEQLDIRPRWAATLSKKFMRQCNGECFCKLLTNIGKQLESPTLPKDGVTLIFTNAEIMTSYIQNLLIVAGERKVSTRIHFMIQDVADLRQTG
ncbi:Eukaryotic translation initiation factor 4G-like protein [Daphnia magna]|uniref:Eukaryotic translation initiation factor 4G-like protein n=1 Tax=Daphnia magna TaxID=35525 RepID=A0A162SCZ8_9CRUS|nr:Eukaryotic translation initiation factor 4G-like protein [Daphnia magna]